MDKRIKIIKEGELGTRPSWDEWFMHIPIGMASRASCNNVHSASIIVANKKIIGEGYNGAPSQIKRNCLETGCRKELRGLDYHNSLNSGECIGIHSEMNALGHLSQKDYSGEIQIFNTIFPCHSCAKSLLSYNLQRVIFKNPYSEKEMLSTLDLLEESDVEICQLNMSPERYIDIAFNHPNVKFDVWTKEEKQKVQEAIKYLQNN